MSVANNQILELSTWVFTLDFPLLYVPHYCPHKCCECIQDYTMYTSYYMYIHRLKLAEEKGIPLKDRQVALSLLLELALQRGTLSHILDCVLLLLKLSAIPDNARNINTAEDVMKKLPPYFQPPGTVETNYPLMPFLARLSQVPTPSSPLPAEQGRAEAGALSPARQYLELVTLPNDDSTKVDLQQVAVVTMSHLDRIAEPYYSIDMVRTQCILCTLLCVCANYFIQ